MTKQKNRIITAIWPLKRVSPSSPMAPKLAQIPLEDITELVALRGLIPICSLCRKVRSDDRLWHNIEDYFERYPQIHFAHSICPEYLKRHDPDYGY